VFPSFWVWQKGVLRNAKDGLMSFPYLHFMGWKKDEWEALPRQSDERLKALAASQCWRVDAQGFHALGVDDCAA
jgi:hypothetical protein